MMTRLTLTLLSLTVFLAALTPVVAAAQDVAEIPFDVPSGALNVVLSASDADATREFYGEILGLKEISPLAIPGSGPMLRFMGGKTEIKFIILDQDLPKSDGGERAALGVRSLTIFVNDAKGVLGKLKKKGHDTAVFYDREGNQLNSGIIPDADGNMVDIVFLPDSLDMYTHGKLRINLTVGDRAATRRFYRSVLGLSEFSASAVGDEQTYMFQAGSTSIRLLHEVPGLPVRTAQHSDNFGLHYIQFVVSDVEAVEAKMKKKGANIVRGPFPLGTMATIMFVADPDGTIVEFAGPQKR